MYAFSLAFDDTGPDNGLFVSTSTDGGLTWGAQVPVIIDRQFEFFNDKNALAADDWASSPNRGNVYLAWDRLIEDPLGQPFVGTYTGPAMFSRSTNGGATFSTPQVVFATGTNKQTIGNVPVAFPNGDVAVLGIYFQNGSLGKKQSEAVGDAFDGRRQDVHCASTGARHAVAACPRSPHRGHRPVVRGSGGRDAVCDMAGRPLLEREAHGRARHLVDRRGSDMPFFAANLALQANGALGSDVFSTRIR